VAKATAEPKEAKTDEDRTNTPVKERMAALAKRREAAAKAEE